MQHEDLEDGAWKLDKSDRCIDNVFEGLSFPQFFSEL